MKTETKTAIILGGIILVAIFAISTVLSSLEEKTDVKKQVGPTDVPVQKIDKSGFKKAPQLVGIANYINTTPEKLKKDIEGKVVLYDIWTYSCINCVRTLPYITSWNEKYAKEGLLIIGIHSPEFEFEKDLQNVEMAVEKYGITYPVVLDNDMKTWNAFDNHYWPRKYLADADGYIRYDHIGEGDYQETEKMIQQLLKERADSLGIKVASAEKLVDLDEFEHTNFRTPELYFGYKFIQGRNQFGNSEGFHPNEDVKYSFPQDLKQNYFYLNGTWKNLEDSMRLTSDSGKIRLQYHAKEVNIVAANNANLKIFLDGSPLPTKYYGNDVVNGEVTVTGSSLYNIIKSDEANTHLLEIDVSDPGFEIYTFTFG